MMDRHAYLATGEGDPLADGDMLSFDISHPCLTFDKRRQILVLDDDFRCVDVVQTYS